MRVGVEAARQVGEARQVGAAERLAARALVDPLAAQLRLLRERRDRVGVEHRADRVERRPFAAVRHHLRPLLLRVARTAVEDGRLARRGADGGAETPHDVGLQRLRRADENVRRRIY